MNTANTFLVIENPQEFSDLYQFQMELDKKFKKEIHIDSSDLISLIFGINNFYELETDKLNFHLNMFNNKMTMVHSLIYYKHLGTLHLLNPHMFEFLDQISTSKAKLSNSLNRDSIATIRFQLNLIDPTEDEIKEGDIQKMLPFSKIEKEVEDRFKLIYLFDSGHPKKRAIYLKEQGVISFKTDENFNISKLTESKLFKKLYSSLNKIEKNKNHNNFHDALALCQLQKKLEDFHEGHKKGIDLPIPLMYGRYKLKEAAEIISKDKDFCVADKYPFIYYGDSGQHLIVQEENFFLIDALYNFKLNSEPATVTFDLFFKQIQDYYKNTLDSKSVNIPKSLQEFTPDGVHLKKAAEKAIHFDFFRKWWEGDGRADLKTSLEIINEFDKARLDNESFSYVDNEFKYLFEELERDILFHNLGLKYIKIVFHRKFMESIVSKHNEAGLLDYDLEQEFLTRFSYPIESVDLIKNFIEKLFITFSKSDLSANDDLKIEMLLQLQYVLDYEVLKLERNEPNKEKFNNLCVMLSILWMEGEYKLLDQFCTEIRNTFVSNFNSEVEKVYYPNYQIALLHASSIIRISSPVLLDYVQVERILDCINNKYNEKTYKAWLGQSFVYSKLWESVSKRLSIPEIMAISQSLKPSENELRKKYYKKCTELAQYTIKMIEELDNSGQNRLRERRKYYAINTYVYIETLNRPMYDFPGNLNKFVIILEGITDTFFSHERYQDTLARFYQRMAAKIAIESPENTSKYNNLVELSIKKTNGAIYSAKKKNNHMDIALFESLMNELEHMKVDGCDYFNGYQNRIELD